MVSPHPNAVWLVKATAHAESGEGWVALPAAHLVESIRDEIELPTIQRCDTDSRDANCISFI
jgi:hypothetical protein